MKNLLIVDGYNSMGYFFKADTRLSLEEKREIFLRKIVNSSYYKKNYHIIVVFDSKQQSFDYSESFNSIEIIFSGYRKNADSIIESIVHSDNSYNRIVVVSSDYALQRVVFGARNTLRKSSREFYDELIRK